MSLDDEPMCKHTTKPVSSTASQSGSQWSVYTDGSPSVVGFSEKATARAPMAAVRRTSSPAATGSQSGTTIRGMSRWGSVAHHSSRMKSL